MRQFAAAAERNRGPILEVLREVLPPSGTILEVASGTGQHVAHFAQALPNLHWQPSDPSEAARRSIEAWTASLDNVSPAADLEVTRLPWPVAIAQGLVCINMLHIAPWPTCSALFEGAADMVAETGPVVVYGPFKRGGGHTAPSNADFDAALRGRDPRWGVRDLEAVEATARDCGFALERVVAMPANNLTLLFRRRSFAV